MKSSLKKSAFLISMFCALIVVAQTPYSFTENWKARNYASPALVTAKSLSTSSSPSATVSINTSTLVAPVLNTQFGVNTTFRNGSDQRTRSALYDGIITTMRYPAGSGSNTYFWDGNIPAQCKDYYDNLGAIQTVTGINGANSNYMTPDIFINFKKDISGEPIVVVNYFYARYGITTAGTRAARVQQAADYAAGFVRKLNVDLGGKVKYWEIGNECYGKWEVGYQVNDASIGTVTGKEYGEDFRTFVAAMKAVDPTIKIGAIVKDVDDAWNAGVLPEVKNTADFLSVHEYFTTVADATPANLQMAVSQISGIRNTLNNCIVTYTGKPATYFPLALTEFNARGSYNCSMFNGVFITQILGEIIKNGFGLSSLWVSEWNWSATENASHGFLAKADPEQNDFTPRPSYIPFYYYGKCFGDYMVSAASTNSAIVPYASVFSSGETGIVLVNTSSASKTVKLNITTSSETLSVTKLQWYEFYANTIEPTVSGYKKFYINGVTSTTTGGGPTDLAAVKPYETVPASNSVITMSAYSVYFLVARTNNLTSLNNTAAKNDTIRIIPMVIHDSFQISDTTELIKTELYNSNGRLISIVRNNDNIISNLPVGYYYLKAVYSKRTIVNKFLKK